MEKARRLDELYGILRVARFGIAALGGFLVFEGMVVLGLYAFYGRVDVPSGVSSSPALLGLDVLALVVGVTVSFVLNERITVRRAEGESRGTPLSMLARLARFQGVSALGNIVVIAVQLLLLATIGLTPAVGSVVGAIAGYPVSYLLSMRVVWRARPAQQS